MTGTLAALVARGLVAQDWARALAPAEPTITRMGEFLRAEVAAGRSYLPAGDSILRAFARPLAEVKVLIVGQDPYPTPGHPVGPQLLGGAARTPHPAQPGQHLQRAPGTTWASRLPSTET